MGWGVGGGAVVLFGGGFRVFGTAGGRGEWKIRVMIVVVMYLDPKVCE